MRKFTFKVPLDADFSNFNIDEIEKLVICYKAVWETAHYFKLEKLILPQNQIPDSVMMEDLDYVEMFLDALYYSPEQVIKMGTKAFAKELCGIFSIWFPNDRPPKNRAKAKESLIGLEMLDEQNRLTPNFEKALRFAIFHFSTDQYTHANLKKYLNGKPIKQHMTPNRKLFEDRAKELMAKGLSEDELIKQMVIESQKNQWLNLRETHNSLMLLLDKQFEVVLKRHQQKYREVFEIFGLPTEGSIDPELVKQVGTHLKVLRSENDFPFMICLNLYALGIVDKHGWHQERWLELMRFIATHKDMVGFRFKDIEYQFQDKFDGIGECRKESGKAKKLIADLQQKDKNSGEILELVLKKAEAQEIELPKELLFILRDALDLQADFPLFMKGYEDFKVAIRWSGY